MNEPEVRIAISVPSGLIHEIDHDLAAPGNGSKFEWSVPAPSESEESLGFDPITGTAIVWVALKFSGKAAVTAAVTLIAKIVERRLNTSAQEQPHYNITIRFPTGGSITIPTDRPLDAKALEERVKQNLLP